MSAVATRTGEWLAGLTEGCERLVHPAVRVEERPRHRRLLCALLAGPFVAAAALAQAAMPAYGSAGVLALLCAVFAASWLAALHVTTRGKVVLAEPAALGSAAVLAGAVVALSGGAGAPATALLAALALETFRISGSARTALAAGAAGVTAAVLFSYGGLGGGAIPIDPAWQWISPVLYGATWLARLLPGGETHSLVQQDNGAANIPAGCMDALVVRLSRAGEVESASLQALDLLGVEPALLLGGGLFDRVHVADRVAFLCAASQVRENKGPSRCDLRIRMPVTCKGTGGGYRPFELEMVKPDEDDDTVVAIIRDGRATAALRDELAAALERAGETEIAKSRFLAAVSHELRTPLNAIIGFSEMLLHREISGELGPKQAEQVGLIREAGNHLLSVVNAILDVSKIEAGAYRITVEPFELKHAVDLCCAMLEPQAAAKGVRLSGTVPHDLGEIIGDQRAIQQVLLNLVSNAIKFTPQGGSVSIGAARGEGRVRLFVNDTGIGISAEDLERLGTPFVQVQNEYTRQFQGTGLGLSLVKGLVRLHGGSMSIESAPALGTTVTIGLPAAEMASPPHGGHLEETGETEEDHGIALHKIA